MLLGDLPEDGHLGRVAQHVHGDDRLGAGGDAALDVLGIERERVVDFGGHGHQAGENRRRVGGHEAVGGDDHLVARLEPAGQVGEEQRAGAGAGRHGVAHADVRGELLLEAEDFALESRVAEVAVARQPSAVEDFQDFLLFFIADPKGSGAGHGIVLLNQVPVFINSSAAAANSSTASWKNCRPSAAVLERGSLRTT